MLWQASTEAPGWRPADHKGACISSLRDCCLGQTWWWLAAVSHGPQRDESLQQQRPAEHKSGLVRRGSQAICESPASFHSSSKASGAHWAALGCRLSVLAVFHLHGLRPCCLPVPAEGHTLREVLRRLFCPLRQEHYTENVSSSPRFTVEKVHSLVPFLFPPGLPVCSPSSAEAKGSQRERGRGSLQALRHWPFPYAPAATSGATQVSSLPSLCPTSAPEFCFLFLLILWGFHTLYFDHGHPPASSQVHRCFKPTQPCFTFISAKLFFKVYFELCIHGCECRCPPRPEDSDLPGAGVTGSCELPVMGAGD